MNKVSIFFFCLLNKEVLFSAIIYCFSSYYYTGFILLFILDKPLKTAVPLCFTVLPPRNVAGDRGTSPAQDSEIGDKIQDFITREQKLLSVSLHNGICSPTVLCFAVVREFNSLLLSCQSLLQPWHAGSYCRRPHWHKVRSKATFWAVILHMTN